MSRRTYKGFFKPKNPKKYKGDHTKIIFRSKWEFDVMHWLDTRDFVVEWQSEEFCIPYLSPLDNRTHRYFPDFYVRMQFPDGTTKVFIVEVKPLKETMPPKPKKRVTKAYITEVATWGKNEAKWKAATEYCKDRGWEFKIMTENDIYGSGFIKRDK